MADAQSSLFSPDWMWKQHVAEQHATSQPRRGLDINAIRTSNPKPKSRIEDPQRPHSTLDVSKDPSIVVAFPTDGLTRDFGVQRTLISHNQTVWPRMAP